VKSILLVLSFAAALSAADTVFELTPAKTEIAFSVHSSLHNVHGKFKLKRGSIRFDTETGKATGEIVIDVTSGATGNASRDKRMHKEILESPKYPEAVFTPDRMEGRLAGQGQSVVDLHGKFNIHGEDHELTLHLNVQADDNQYTASTHFTIPYAEWGMKNPSNFLLRVGGAVDVDVKTVIGRE
jgi:polyisoprenoid-binding protein YceI